jgi:ribonuclease HI
MLEALQAGSTDQCIQAPASARAKPSPLAQAQELLTPMQQQGDYYPDHPKRYDVTIGQALRNQLLIHTSAINPHTDIEPTGRHEVFIREVEMRTDKQNWLKTLACIYTPDGKCHYTLTPERAAVLYSKYQQAMQYKPKLMRKLKAGSFAEELYALMCRYRDGSDIDSSRHDDHIKLSNHWATPPELYDALQQLTGITKERFASPLNFNPKMQQYWSVHKRDQIFGARWDTYRYQWTGSSVHNPEYEDPALNKNMATAVAAAQHTQAPVLGVHILPAWTDSNRTSYMAWLSHYPENCKHVLQIPRRHFRFQKPTTWELGDMYAGHPRWDVNIVVTGNQAGFTQHFPYWNEAYMQRFYSTMQEALNATLPTEHEVRNLAAHAPNPGLPNSNSTVPRSQLKLMAFPSSKKYSKRRGDYLSESDLAAPLGMETAEADMDQPLTSLNHMLPPAPPLKHDWRQFAYTDGSCRQEGCNWPKEAPGLGAAVYIPGAESEDETLALPIIPVGPQAQQNTINRAELVGILYARRHGALHIATDSLTSMYQLRKMVQRPQDMREHQHRRLLEQIVATIQTSEQPVHLWKVKGHAKLVGNECADELAKGAASSSIPEGACTVYDEPSNERSDQHWPHEVTEEERQPSARAGPCGQVPAGKRVRRTPLVDLGKALKAVSHKHCKLGRAKRDTLYFEKWTSTAPLRDAAASNAFMTSRDIKHAERKTALRYRFGQMWTRKRAYRCGFAEHSRCLLCGQEDGGHHTASGCTALTGLYTERHNKLGRLIMKHVIRGRRGGYVIQMDLGSAEKCEQDGIEQQPTRYVPWTALPAGLRAAMQAVGEGNGRPDGMLYKPASQKEKAEYWIIEVKVCRDTEPGGQQARAAAQHMRLCEELQRQDSDARVHFLPIMVGVTGSIYYETKSMLEDDLGVEGQALKGCLRSIHLQAVRSLHGIYTVKRQKEQKLLPHTKGKRPW